MAAFNIPPPSTTTTTFSSLPSSYCHSNITRTSYFNNDYNNNKKYSRGFHFSLFSSQTYPSSSSSSSKTKRELSKMPTHFSKSGSGHSWIQDGSMNRNSTSSNKGMQGPLHSVFPSTPAQVSSVEDLFEFICSGPLISKLGLTSEMIAESIDKWISYGLLLCRLFQLNELFLTVPQKARFYHYYIPVFIWCEDKICKHVSQFKDSEDIPPLVIGFSAPQGCGKTTLVFALDYLFKVTGRKSAMLSIDDFYLTAEGQAKLRETNPGNALLEFRGNAGSHDLPFSIETLSALNQLTKEGMKVRLPRYDKSAYSGRGDRADPSTWPEVKGPLTVVLFEGWMLGFKPLPVEVVQAVDPQLEIINKNLEAYYDAWYKFIKAWVVIKIQDPSCVYHWRLQAEIAMREDGNPGMTDEEVKDFVSRYLPAYKAYLPTLYAEGPSGSDPENLLLIEIDEGRNPILGN
uniref:Phosphoribulokinase/uridine kinase domain-containing protein n=1 Tax=Populus davidiana TaxID=266767 RepID=A0A6M2FAZ0_9ROSI